MSLPTRPKLLVVDDDAVYRELLEMALDSRGYEVLLAEDGADAISGLETFEPDLILLDVFMPRLDGLRFLEWLRQESRSEVPVLVVTCLDQRETTVDALVAGATEVLVKPVRFTLLLQKIEDLLRGRAGVDPVSSGGEYMGIRESIDG